MSHLFPITGDAEAGMQGIQHLFVDEAGAPRLFHESGKVILDTPGCIGNKRKRSAGQGHGLARGLFTGYLSRFPSKISEPPARSASALRVPVLKVDRSRAGQPLRRCRPLFTQFVPLGEIRFPPGDACSRPHPSHTPARAPRSGGSIICPRKAKLAARPPPKLICNH